MTQDDDRRQTRLRAIVQHIPAFLDPAAPMGVWYQPETQPGCFSSASFVLDPSAERFVADCYAHGWVLQGFDWVSWAQTLEAQTLRDEPVALAHATEHQLAQLLTVVIRQSRFSESSLAGAFGSGLILGILRRAEQIRLTS